MDSIPRSIRFETDTQGDESGSGAAHPSSAQLFQYGLGRCSEAESDRIEQHVLECDACCEKLASLPSDGLLQRLSQRTPDHDTDRGFAETNFSHNVPTSGGNSKQFADLLRDHPKYEFVRHIGSGGMGVVYQAAHRVMNRMVALKVIAPRFLLDDEVKTRFRREVEIAAKLQHRNVVAAFDAEEVEGHLFLVSEFVDGFGIDQLINKETIPIRKACQIASQAAAGLEHAHEHGLIHRDVKPQNMLLSKEGIVKVVDFGLASYVEPTCPDEQGLTSAGIIVGTPDYLSPEQAREGKVDHRADIYSLGCTLYHLIAGRPPFGGSSRVEKLAGHLQENPKSLVELRQDVPIELESCVARMMAKDPEQRFQSAREVIDALKPFASQDAAPQRIRPTRAPIRSTRRRLMVGAFVAVVACASVAYFLVPPTKSIEDARLLAVMPHNALERDVENLRVASQAMGIDDQVTVTSSKPRIDWSGTFIPFDQVRPNDYDAVIFVGSQQNIATELTSEASAREQVSAILRTMRSADKPIAGLCSGMWPLTRLGVTRGKQVADCTHTTDEFKAESGADWLPGETLVIDGRLITASNEQDAKPMLKAILKQVTGK